MRAVHNGRLHPIILMTRITTAMSMTVMTTPAAIATTDAHRAASLQRLPVPYATALRLHDAGISDEVIAECIGVELDALPTFMRVAEAKLAAALLER
jgi:DNA-directed RNA polymerase specialized sigma24 family protein